MLYLPLPLRSITLADIHCYHSNLKLLHAEASSAVELIRCYRKFMARKKVFFFLFLFAYKSLINGLKDLV